MTDGWYRVIHPTLGHKVQFFYKNQCELGSVIGLMRQGFRMEEVHVLSERELQEVIEHAVQERLQTLPVYGENQGIEASNPHQWCYPTAP